MCRIPRLRLFNLQTKKRTVEQKASKGLNGKDKIKIKSSKRAAFFRLRKNTLSFFLLYC